MTIISKIKLIIEYAKIGIAFTELYKNKWPVDIVYPNKITEIPSINKTLSSNIDWMAKSITAYGVTKIGGNGLFKSNKVLQEIYLPNCKGIYGWNVFEGANSLIKARFPKVKELTAAHFIDCASLTLLEVGSLSTMYQTAVKNTALTEFIVGEGTTATLYLNYCPNLTKECLENIIDNYADMTGKKAPTFQIGNANISKISPEYLQKLRDKNIDYC